MIANHTNLSKRTVLLIGNFISATVGIRSYCEDLADQLSIANWKVLRASSKRNRILRVIDMLLTTYRRRNEYDVAHVDVYSGPAFLWAEVVCRVLKYNGKPFVLTLHGGDLPSFGRGRQKQIEYLLRSATRVTTPSPYLFEAMRGFREDLNILPNAIDLRVYKFHLREVARPKLIWLRSFHSIYNPSLAARVVSILSKEFQDIHLAMVGYDSGDGSRQAVERLAVELKIKNHISFHSGVTKAEVPHWMNKGDIFLNTAKIDNTPVTVLEAMACGLCCVSTKVGGIPHLLKENNNGLLVPSDDPAAMASAVKRILTDPDLARTISLNGHKKTQEFDWSTIFPVWDDFLTSACKAVS